MRKHTCTLYSVCLVHHLVCVYSWSPCLPCCASHANHPPQNALITILVTAVHPIPLPIQFLPFTRMPLLFHRLPPLILYQIHRLPSLVHQTFPPHLLLCLLMYFSMLFHPNLRSCLHSLHRLLVCSTCSRSPSLTTPSRGLESGQPG